MSNKNNSKMKKKAIKPKRGRPALGKGKGRETPVHGVRCSDEAWEALKALASRHGHTSVAAWAEALLRSK